MIIVKVGLMSLGTIAGVIGLAALVVWVLVRDCLRRSWGY